ncbi:DegT/DnrJ/EryC1/StrS family aminotransferase [Lentibacillus sp. Marseille-P4043]|uniref:DegT/DnrJ/EryC1/StrS family aminotransferase n=1 Tax=Lentibacillus sp. Marseille-P4043 TaxID=2040293 RepID=UPI000D0BE3FE|nr:DegT/DnrJ/EryC1/StrS family aminotransferase [Lentibacillus sp. Marseille-P4043]
METLEKIFLSSPHMSGNEQKYIQMPTGRDWASTLGNNVDAFENELATYNLINDATAVTSRTAAIQLALRLTHVGKGDTVFCSSLTSVETAKPIVFYGAKPVFIDSEPDTWNMSPAALQRAFLDAIEQKKLPKAVVIVNSYGQSAKMDELLEICDAYGVPVIEDAAESLGSEFKGRKSGTFGRFGIFSFDESSIITTSEGGALISNDVEALKKARFLATQSRDPALHNQHSTEGYSYRMNNIVAGFGRAQLEVLNDHVAKRRAVFDRYHEAFDQMDGIEFQPELEESKSNRWLTAFTIDPDITGISRDDIIRAFEAENIEVCPVWQPMHLQPLFIEMDYYPHEEGKSVSDQLYEKGVCLPSGSDLTEAEQERVIQVIQDLLK